MLQAQPEVNEDGAITDNGFAFLVRYTETWMLSALCTDSGKIAKKLPRNHSISVCDYISLCSLENKETPKFLRVSGQIKPENYIQLVLIY